MPDEFTYETGQWAGLPNYTCNHCKYATLELDAIEGHLDEHRRGNVRPFTPEEMQRMQARRAQRTDAFGNPVGGEPLPAGRTPAEVQRAGDAAVKRQVRAEREAARNRPAPSVSTAEGSEEPEDGED